MENKTHILLTAAAGTATGFINGLFGGGGGMIVVPVLIYLLNYPPKTAHATAILVILPVSVLSAVMYICLGKFDSQIVVPVSIGALTGGFLGAKLLMKLNPKTLSLVFAALMFLAGLRMAI